LEERQYTRLQRKLHWWVACLVPIQYLGQNAMRSAMERVDTAQASTQTSIQTPTLGDFLITTGHSFVGISILVLIIWRLKLRRDNPVPVASNSEPASSTVLGILAQAWHLALYLAIGLMAVSGGLTYYTEFGPAGRVHELGKWLLGTLVIGHILAGLTHWLVFRDQVMQGMLVQRRDADTIRSSDQSQD